MKENFSKLEYLVIISYYDTDIEWTKKIKLPYRIYYKDKQKKEPFNAINKAKSETNICKFLYQFYDKLPENTIFVHQYEYKSYHNGSLVDLLNSSKLYDNYKRSKTPGYISLNCKKMGNINSQKKKMVYSGWWGGTMSYFFGNILRYHNFTKNKKACAQFIVSKQRVRSLPKEFYGNMYNWLVKNSIGNTNKGIDPISKMRLFSPIDNHILSNYYTSRYMEWSYELIFTTYKKNENDFYKFNINNKEFELLALYGFDSYYVNVSFFFNQEFLFLKENKIIIKKEIVFNDIFYDYLVGSNKNLKFKIKNIGKYILYEKRNKDFILEL